jgi:hypothetical protein
MIMDYVTRAGVRVLFEAKQKLAKEYDLGDSRITKIHKEWMAKVTEMAQ